MDECTFEGCTNGVHVKKLGLCAGHYAQNRRGKELSVLQEQKRKPNETYCLKCNTQKAREDFYLRTNGRLQHACIECLKATAQARRDRIAEALKRLKAIEQNNGQLKEGVQNAKRAMEEH